MSLSAEEAAQTGGSEPDTLEVREDSLAILQNSMSSLRKPILYAAVASGVVVLLLIGSRLLRRATTDAG